MMQAPQDVLRFAHAQLQQGNLQESEEAFRRVVTSGQYVAQGLYGVGVVRRKLNDLAGAKYYLTQSLQQDPSYADTHYQLGRIAQQQQNWEEARGYFRKAIAIDTQHNKAQQALSQLPGGVVEAVDATKPAFPTQNSQASASAPNFPMQSFSAPNYPPVAGRQGQGQDHYNMPTVAGNPVALPPSPDDFYGSNHDYGSAQSKGPQRAVGAGQVANSYVQPQQYGAYDFLRDDPSRRAQNTLATIDALRIKGHPSVSAYLDSFVGSFFGLLFVIAFAICLSLLTSGSVAKNLAIVLVIVSGLAGIWGLFSLIQGLIRYLGIISTEYKIDQGRFQIRRGIFGKETLTYELLRVHNIEYKQSFLNRLTGDGILIFHIEQEPKPLVVKGLVKGKKLEETYQQFLNLVSLLRFNPNVKGFIQ